MPDIFNPQNKLEEKEKKVTPSIGSQLYSKSDNGGISHLLSSFLFMPQNTRFETQEEGENVVLLLRKHWITNVSWILTCVIFLVAPIFILPALFLNGLVPVDFPDKIINAVIIYWYMSVFSYAFVSFLMWYFTVSIVTETRVVDVDFINILHKKSAETRIAKVEDVTERTGGFIRSLFDFGDVFLQTAAKDAMFQFEAVPHPARIVKIVNNLLGKSIEEEV
jgi:hypothetical protein